MGYRCRNWRKCHNTYTEIIGGDGWGKIRSGADCLPCYFAGLMRSIGQTPEDVEKHPEFMQQMVSHLAKGGWNWEHVKASYALGVTLL